jgi:hypothetical protein
MGGTGTCTYIGAIRARARKWRQRDLLELYSSWSTGGKDWPERYGGWSTSGCHKRARGVGLEQASGSSTTFFLGRIVLHDTLQDDTSSKSYPGSERG